MKKASDQISKALAKWVNKQTTKEFMGWPPTCEGYLFEPERPVSTNSVSFRGDTQAGN